jgi:hypothetical protein
VVADGTKYREREGRIMRGGEVAADGNKDGKRKGRLEIHSIMWQEHEGGKKAGGGGCEES